MVLKKTFQLIILGFIYKLQEKYGLTFIFSVVPAVHGSVYCLRSDYLYSSTQYPLPLHINLCTVFVIKFLIFFQQD